MPNNTTNYVKVSGKIGRLAQMQDYVKAEGDSEEESISFSLNKVIPMPSELRGTPSPARIVSDEEYIKYYSTEETAKRLLEREEAIKNNEYYFGDQQKPMTKEMQEDYIKRFGYDNWYDWAIHTWHTKWDTYDHDFWKDYDDKEVITNPGAIGEMEYFFYTAWSPPEPIYNILSDVFGDLEIVWSYIDEGGGFCGTFGTREHYEKAHGNDCECFNFFGEPQFEEDE